MDLESLKNFFLWCLIINSVLYTITAVAVLFCRDFICRTHEKWFALDRPAVLQSIHRYLATFKLLVTVFNFAPWIALLIITWPC